MEFYNSCLKKIVYGQENNDFDFSRISTPLVHGQTYVCKTLPENNSIVTDCYPIKSMQFEIRNIKESATYDNTYSCSVRVLSYEEGREYPQTDNVVVVGYFYNAYPEAVYETCGYWDQGKDGRDIFFVTERQQVITSSENSIKKYLSSIQVLEFCDICNAYLRGEYNALIKSIQSNGYAIRSLSDKKAISDLMASIVVNHDLSMWQAIELAAEKKLIKFSDSCINKIERERAFVEQYRTDEFYKKFKELYLAGNNTYPRIKDMIDIPSEDVFDDWESIYKRECFINELLSPDLKFVEALNYSKYLAEETEYITMHKTKGSSIQNVIVVMDEFFWKSLIVIFIFGIWYV